MTKIEGLSEENEISPETLEDIKAIALIATQISEESLKGLIDLMYSHHPEDTKFLNSVLLSD
ncbi:hypothetical protein KW795_00850 [Candidatus Microgenomates bacterium]|nr:hypothetical protein [Candidatus Microgenomates bacterium]